MMDNPSTVAPVDSTLVPEDDSNIVPMNSTVAPQPEVPFELAAALDAQFEESDKKDKEHNRTKKARYSFHFSLLVNS
ncbi:hypothetical protein B9Z55_015699 [Caenorhabditis nigoni]|nr:hypothetical protein B9Z55_015699 [Caenorhabditis nigoni]